MHIYFQKANNGSLIQQFLTHLLVIFAVFRKLDNFLLLNRAMVWTCWMYGW